jgi:hypothetical protein
MNCLVSAAEDLPTQVSDAIKFLSEFRAELSDPNLRPRGPVLDFGIWQREGAAILFRLPVELISLAGEFHLAIELSQYASSEG